MNVNDTEITKSFLQLARTALTGRPQDIHLTLHRASKKLKDDYPGLTEEIVKLLQESPTRSTPLRKEREMALPVDIDSRLKLLRVESVELEHELILNRSVEEILLEVLAERKNSAMLHKSGLHPTKTMLFTGPPGVGKTMAAKWIAKKLDRPLLVLDLAAVMSSFLGRTGNNIRFVLDYAKGTECVLLLDELDAIAKRRDDSTEIGELKRLVTVLLQEIDDWPSTGLLLAATNHPDLLDPAIWRRFDTILKFDTPTPEQIRQLVLNLITDQIPDTANDWAKVLSLVFTGSSYSHIERQIARSRRAAALGNDSLENKLELLLNDVTNLNHEQRVNLAIALESDAGLSQRRASEITGISRDTMRKVTKGRNKKKS